VEAAVGIEPTYGALQAPAFGSLTCPNACNEYQKGTTPKSRSRKYHESTTIWSCQELFVTPFGRSGGVVESVGLPADLDGAGLGLGLVGEQFQHL